MKEKSVIRDCDGKIICHRSWVKVIFNPLLRMFGFVIISRFLVPDDSVNREIFDGYEIRRYSK